MMVSIAGKRAMTEWTVLERFGGVALLRCQLLTGRQHQIRVHLSYVGTPLLVDELYGSAPAFYLSSMKSRYRASGRHEERPLIDRLTLHAESIEFTPPGRSDRLKITAEPPKDFRATLNQLRRLRGRGIGRP
jgi:23S rRNA-/tRNA-specific pseudouridylate synthase